jgi:hypothetical protein
MVITPYQVNNVLRVYGDQLRHNKSASSRWKGDNPDSSDKINISVAGKRKVLIDKISSEIVNKISQYGPHENVEKEVFKKLEDEYGAHLAIDSKSPADLVFKVIDEDGETMNSLSIEDSKFLRYKLEEITKETVNKNIM